MAASPVQTVGTAAPIPDPTPEASAAAAPLAPFACAAAFCYPRLGITGAVVPYSDCTGHSDIGSEIVELTCTTPTYLIGHAYTQFGRIVNWQAGDEVWVYGDRYAVYGAVMTRCGAWPPPLGGRLRMQTSLTSGCGPVLVVLAH
ncbi:MAG: hypothetical protein M3O91_07550 [Chloroflexota bacterium]|nr:hypothetical protein [Chloroflexota bacterium]